MSVSFVQVRVSPHFILQMINLSTLDDVVVTVRRVVRDKIN